MYIPAEPLIILIPLIIGLVTGKVVWNGYEFTLKEKDQEPETPDLKKFNDSYIISK